VGTAKRERQKANRQQRLEQMARQVQKDRRKKGFTRWGVLIVVGALAIILIAVISGGKSGTSTAPTTSSEAPPVTAPPPVTVPGATLTGDTPCPATDGSSARTLVFAKAPPMCIDPAKTYKAVVNTTLGEYTIELDAKNAPKTVNNYVVLALYHYYDGTPCHRILAGFMAQCGDPSGTGSGDNAKYPGYTFADENKPATASYPKGTLAMANAGPDTNGSQYFTMLKDYPLPASYSVFGKVTDGLDTTLPALEAAAGSSATNGTPTKVPVYINTVTILVS